MRLPPIKDFFYTYQFFFLIESHLNVSKKTLLRYSAFFNDTSQVDPGT